MISFEDLLENYEFIEKHVTYSAWDYEVDFIWMVFFFVDYVTFAKSLGDQERDDVWHEGGVVLLEKGYLSGESFVHSQRDFKS